MGKLNLLDLQRVLRENSNDRLKLVRQHLIFSDDPVMCVSTGDQQFTYRFHREGKSLTLSSMAALNPGPLPEPSRRVGCSELTRKGAELCLQILTQSLAEVGYSTTVSTSVELEVSWGQ